MFGLRLGALIGLSCCAVPAVDWPQWRGPNRDGKSPETGLMASWPSGGPRLLWRAQGLGAGYSSFAVVGDRLYTQGQQGGQQFVIALDTNTGKQLWKSATGRAYGNDRGDGPRGTPTIDGNRLYAVNGEGVLVCLDTSSGKRLWGVDFVRQFGGRVPRWGYSESPLVEGDRLIVTPGGRGAAVAALNKATGEVLWRSQSDGAGYSSAIPFDAGGVRGVAVLTADAVIGLDVRNGNLLWRYEKVANGTANVATPIAHSGHLFVSTDYGTGAALLRLTPSSGTVGAAEVYFTRDMRNHYTTSVLVGDHVYGFSSSILTAMNFLTGKVAWTARSVGKGNCIYADGRLYCLGEGGAVGLIEPAPAGYKEVSRFEFPPGRNPTWTPPVVSDGKLFLREQDNLYCHGIKRPN
ncbi:MAG TPA: PQQ-binding-like beta-propeller repeat protein [Bryobacteraceae bacterium]|nr:PQQ-binding-like beta-propeller repeat protein [Bryobacteraceae bacterium]